jgi:hypothetical protein
LVILERESYIECILESVYYHGSLNLGVPVLGFQTVHLLREGYVGIEFLRNFYQKGVLVIDTVSDKRSDILQEAPLGTLWSVI